MSSNTAPSGISFVPTSFDLQAEYRILRARFGIARFVRRGSAFAPYQRMRGRIGCCVLGLAVFDARSQTRVRHRLGGAMADTWHRAAHLGSQYNPCAVLGVPPPFLRNELT